MRFNVNGINAISVPSGTGAVTSPKALGNAPAQQGLAGFLNLIFAQINASSAPATPAGTAAPLQNLPGLSALPIPSAASSATADGLAEKIAALLQGGAAEATGIGGLLQGLTPQDQKSIAGKVANLLQGQPLDPTLRPATLLQDLTAALAPALQETAIPAMQTQAPDTTDLATMLNALQPGSGTPENSQLMQLLAAHEAGQESGDLPDTAILEQLKAKFGELGLTNGAINRDILVAFKADAMQFLQQQGFDQPTVQKYLTALAKTLRQEPSGQVFIQNTAAPVLSEGTPELPAASADQRGLQTAQKSVMNAASPVAQQALAAATIAPQATTPAKPAAPLMTSHPALVNAMTGSGNGANGFQSGEFGHQSGQQTFTSDTSSLMADSLKVTNETTHQGFVNYMTAARQGQGATTQMVALHIQRNAAAKMDTFTMQLNPAELGKLEIRLKFGKDGAMKAHLIADKPETLALLQKDSTQLERILQQSGLDMDENALSFDLRQQDHHQRQLHDRDNNNNNADTDFIAQLNGNAPEKKANALLAVQTYGTISPNGVNITV